MNISLPVSHIMYLCPTSCTCVPHHVPVSQIVYLCPKSCTCVPHHLPVSHITCQCPISCTYIPCSCVLCTDTRNPILGEFLDRKSERTEIGYIHHTFLPQTCSRPFVYIHFNYAFDLDRYTDGTSKITQRFLHRSNS